MATITISKSRVPSNPEAKPLGKITSYNWQEDPYTDTNSRNMTGRFDLHYPEGKSPHEKDGVSVVGFQKLASAE